MSRRSSALFIPVSPNEWDYSILHLFCIFRIAVKLGGEELFLIFDTDGYDKRISRKYDKAIPRAENERYH